MALPCVTTLSSIYELINVNEKLVELSAPDYDNLSLGDMFKYFVCKYFQI